ncbi:MAG: recombination mediator RecR [Alphaproteobacteria bacterium]
MQGGEIDRLIAALARLPGLGPRSARRAVLDMVRKRGRLMDPLRKALDDVAEHVRECATCGNIDTIDPCAICADPRRDPTLICVVADVGDLWAMERAQVFKGRYHVLGGLLSAMDGVRPEDLHIDNLVARASATAVNEIVLATDMTVDGQTTAHYVSDRLAEAGVTVSGLAHGVPVGGELDYLDDGTIAAALKARQKL